MRLFRSNAVFVVSCFVLFLPIHLHAAQGNDRDLVQAVVNHELEADRNDHSRWMYRDVNKEHGKSTVRLVVQTSQGDLSKTIEINGQPLTPEQQKADEQRMHQFVTDQAVREKQKESHKQDDQKAAALTRMLPDAFQWKKIAEQADETTLAFQPNPKFNPPTREARVFAAMKGTMVVNTKQNRIQALQGELISDVNFGWLGVLGKLKRGGTFSIKRQNISGTVWVITETHVHIIGHALLFKTISEQQDEVTSHYQPAPQSITLAEAEKMLNDGTVAKKLGITQQN